MCVVKLSQILNCLNKLSLENNTLTCKNDHTPNFFREKWNFPCYFVILIYFTGSNNFIKFQMFFFIRSQKVWQPIFRFLFKILRFNRFLVVYLSVLDENFNNKCHKNHKYYALCQKKVRKFVRVYEHFCKRKKHIVINKFQKNSLDSIKYIRINESGYRDGIENSIFLKKKWGV